MKSGGYIRLHRRILEHPLYSNSRFFLIWIHFLLKANFKATAVIVEGKRYEVPRGSFISSYRNIAKDTGTSIGTVYRAVQFFLGEKMVEQSRNAFGSMFIVSKYNLYQEDETVAEQSWNNNKNDKKDKNINIKDGFTKKLKDGTTAVRQFGMWKDQATGAKLNLNYYPELKQYG